MNKRSQLAHVLRSYAGDLQVAGPQYASMAGVLYDAADELDPPGGSGLLDSVFAPVVDDDGFPPFAGKFLNCWDE
jgi:hypothetical protein